MSTRSQIFVEASGVIIYRHNDGYPDGPSGVLATLCPVVQVFHSQHGHDVHYMPAQILFAMKPTAPGILGFGILGFGIEGHNDELQGDIEFLYIVRKNGQIEVREPGGTNKMADTVLLYVVNLDGEKLK